ncbi:hypothetical protein VT84_27985 [Gemmata sp. SH-PL17]|nr:hypothetical protein VT84_27985 [Gemmata sp. SH-PL17]
MIEADWIFDWRTCEFSTNELERWEWNRGARKRRLFVIACYLELLPLLVDERSRAAIDAAERHADGLLTDAELQTARGIAEFAAWEAENSDEFSDKERAAMAVLPWVAVSNGELMDPNFNPTGYALDLMEGEKQVFSGNCGLMCTGHANRSNSPLRGTLPPRSHSHPKCTSRVISPRCPFWLMRSRTRAVIAPTF